MLKLSGHTPTELREQVTSPNGTTHAGLEVLRTRGFEDAVVSCVLKATERSRQLSTSLNPEPGLTAAST